MKNYEKQVEQAQLNSEKAVLKDLKAMYQESLDNINEKIELLQAKPLIQSKVYQIEFQNALKSQIETFLDMLHSKEYDTIEAFLKDSYNNGFTGTMYSLQQQGIPLILPINQNQVVRAIQIDSKISKGLYTKLGEDIKELKKKISSEVARGISQAMGYSDIARNISNVSNTGLNNAMRIARTESHRIKSQSTNDAAIGAKKKGADVLKQWDATLDGNTRDSHRQLDGQIRELDEDFTCSSGSAPYPGGFGDPAEDCNCRCVQLTRARWALDDEELETLKEHAKYFELDKTKDFEEYKKKYLQVVEGLGAKISGQGVPEHEEPILIKDIDYSDKKAVKSELQSFEKNAITEDIETACVITNTGKIYKCFGFENRVFPDFDLGDLLMGASVSHNHLISETSYTFSGNDLALFVDYDLEILRGCDEKYTYELTRDASSIDDVPEDWMSFENFEHGRVIEKAKLLGIGYRRWINEQRRGK